ncbi:U-box domain-containing protein 35-like [Chenopodium quinoa]|uniref:U-box domain-containing protein 35-like n=1 Tax=Chenopodium quinoa TaxID=63459 RepID=UPI000B78A299|nr:U-box domain-containing protein 35-like [Chenopodium quinoa]
MAERKAADQEQLLVAVALTGSRKSKYILKWALDKFLPEGDVTFKLIYVYPKITLVPTPMGTWLPVSQVREEVVNGYRQEIEWKKQRKILPYHKILKAQKVFFSPSYNLYRRVILLESVYPYSVNAIFTKTETVSSVCTVKSEIVVLESDDIAMALSLEITRKAIRHLVIGVTSTSIFSMSHSENQFYCRKNLTLIRGDDLSQVISENVPGFCSVYVIGDGKLQQIRPADSEQNVIHMDETSNLSSTSTSNLSGTSTDSSSSSSSLTIGRLLKSRPSSPRYGSFASGPPASESSTSVSQPKQHEYLPRNAAGPKVLARETTELKHYFFKDTNSNVGNASIQSHSSSSGDSGSWASDRTSPGSSFAGIQPNAQSPTGTPSPRSFLYTPSTGSFVGNSPAVSYAETPPTGFYKGTPPMVSPVGTPYAGTPLALSRPGTPPGGAYVDTHAVPYAGTPPTGSYAGTPLALSRPGTPPGRSYVDTHPVPCAGTLSSVSFSGISSGSEQSASPNQMSELEKLRIELRHIQKMYELTQNSSIDERFQFPLDQLQEMSKERLEEALKLKEEKCKEVASIEKNKTKAAQFATIDTGVKAERNKLKNRSDSKAAQEEESKNRLKELFASPAVQYQKFTWEEIVEATSSLSEEFKIGAGAFGIVYKCKLHHTTVAVKVLHSKDSVTNKQFVQELEILSTIRHPHLLLLLGAVPEESSLVYEYMDYGSLDDVLFHKNGKPPLPWYERFRICYEVAGALAFLHSTKPRPIIHRDLKPANILLDHNLVSKIGDAGLGTMINVEPSDMSLKTIYKETSPVGTLCYIDPEYQRTGRVSTKSDIYALGVVILQILTAKPAVGISYLVEDAIDEDNLIEILDPEAGEWPEKETLELALLGLQCSELRGRDRPDLREKVLPALEKMNEVADSARDLASNAQTATPVHFICPILKDVMEDPYVAADGYTYDRRAIEQWLTENDTSPSTNHPLPHKFIMPNTALLEAIKQWKSKNTR